MTWSSTPPTTPSTTTRSTRTPATSSPTTTTPRGTRDRARSGSTTAITADRAKEIALAEVPGATASDIYEFETDRDDGRLEYEGTIYYNGTEYDFTIDGYSGAIRGWDVERHG